MQKGIKIARWIFSILFILGGLGSFADGAFLFALLTTLFGVSLLPIIWQLLQRKGIVFKKWIPVAIPVILFLGCMITVPKTQKTPTTESVKSVAEATNEPTKKTASTPAVTITATPTPTETPTPELTPTATPTPKETAASETAPEPSKAAATSANTPEESSASVQEQPTAQSTPEVTPEITEAPVAVNTAEMVWISETGSKYHNKPDCGKMNPNKAYQISRSTAESQGYEACKKCY